MEEEVKNCKVKNNENLKTGNLMNDMQYPNVTNNTTNIIINNLTYLNATGTETSNIVEELNRGGAAIIKNPELNTNVIEEIKIIGSKFRDQNTFINKCKFSNNNLDDSSLRMNSDINSKPNEINNAFNNFNNNIKGEIIEKIQTEIKCLENISTNNSKNITIGNNCTNTALNTKLINSFKNSNNTPENKNNSISNKNNNQNRKESPISEVITKKAKESPNKNIDRYVKKKISPYVAASNVNYNSEKSGYSSSLNYNNNIKKDSQNANNTNLSTTQNKFILNKLHAATNKKITPKNAFFNTSMSFDQNNDTKNTTFDNELVKKIENREKSDEKNLSSIGRLGIKENNRHGKNLSITEITNAIKANNQISKNKNPNGNNHINENYLMKKSVNKKFDTIREEDEDIKTQKKPFSYLNYYTKYAPENKNQRLSMNSTNNYNADSNYPTNSNANSSILKKITKRFTNESSFLEQYVTNNKKNIISSSHGPSPNKKSSVSPTFKYAANSSRIQNANINTSVSKDIYTITENSFSNSFKKNRLNTGGNIYNPNNIANSNLNNSGKSGGYNNTSNAKNNIEEIATTSAYCSVNKTEVLDFNKNARGKNVSSLNAQKYTIPSKPKFKKINITNISNLNNNNNFIGAVNSLAVTNEGFSNKSPLKRPPVSTSITPVIKKAMNASSKIKNNINLNLTGNSITLNNSARKNTTSSNLKGMIGNKIQEKQNLNLTTQNINKTLATEDNIQDYGNIKIENMSNFKEININNMNVIKRKSQTLSKNHFVSEGDLNFKKF